MKMYLLKKKKLLLTYILAMSLSASSLTGCSIGNFYYTVQENGDLVVGGTISFDKFKKLKLIHLTNETVLIDKYVLAIVNDKYSGRVWQGFSYVDIETGKIVYEDKENDFKNFNLEVVVDIMYDYIYKYDMIKDSYDIEDIKKLKEYLLNDETLNIGKTEEQEEIDKEEARVFRKSKKYC